MAEYYRPARIIRGNGPHSMRWGTWLGDDERDAVRELLLDALMTSAYGTSAEAMADTLLRVLGVPETPQAVS